MLTGESGEVARDELELGHRLWLRKENAGLMGADAFDAADEFRECSVVVHVEAVDLASISSALMEV